MKRLQHLLVSFAVACVALVASSCTEEPYIVDYRGPTADWPAYGGTVGGGSYSALNQIDRTNVAHLEVAWEHRHGDVSDGKGEVGRTSFQAHPIVAGGRLYYCTPFNRVFALDPESGQELWRFDPRLRLKGGEGPYPLTCRGVTYWHDETADDDAVCAERIFTGTRDSELIALDAATGEPCADFGAEGRVNLRDGLGDYPAWESYPTSAPVVVRDVVMVGALVADSLRTDAPPGVIRGYDTRTGALRWAFDPVPPGWKVRPSEDGRLYEAGTPNVWTVFSGDNENGLVFLPTGNPSPDSYAAERRGLDYYGSSTVAVDVTDGSVAWHFQTVHHDVWDYDVASQPAAFQIDGVGEGRPGLVQATKMGHLFLLDRVTGEPLYPVEERPVPQSTVPGEKLSPTQPFPTHPPPIHPTELGPANPWGFTPFDRADCADRMTEHRTEGIFTPPSLEGTVQFPGPAGGPNWGGVSIDPVGARLFVNQMRTASVVTLIPRPEFNKLDFANAVYPNELYPMHGTPYGVKRTPLLSNFGAPCNPPPWGVMTAVDLKTGETAWEVPLGTTRDQAPWPLWFRSGAPNLGGSIATAGGLVFIGATTDKFLRAFDTDTGELVWEQRLPYTANSTPATYRLTPQSRQYVVVAAGGHGWSEPGDAVIAYALPD